MIRVENLVKDYNLHGGGSRRVLDHVTFDIEPGERVAVLGRNGAGKSTLVRVMGGIEPPTRGTIERRMSMSWPLGLHGGFQGSLTGADNIGFISRIYGKDYREAYEFVDEFSELGAFLRQPVKTYSSGMRARLAFGISLAIDFDCYLIDEVIFVGDARFHEKCRVELFEKRRDRALFLVTHDAGVINQYCTSALVLHSGRAKQFFDTQLALDIYAHL